MIASRSAAAERSGSWALGCWYYALARVGLLAVRALLGALRPVSLSAHPSRGGREKVWPPRACATGSGRKAARTRGAPDGHESHARRGCGSLAASSIASFGLSPVGWCKHARVESQANPSAPKHAATLTAPHAHTACRLHHLRALEKQRVRGNRAARRACQHGYLWAPGGGSPVTGSERNSSVCLLCTPGLPAWCCCGGACSPCTVCAGACG